MGQQFYNAVSMAEICRAIKECRKGVGYKDGPTDWYIHRLIRAEALQREILSGRYKLRPGTVVQIYRPKRREAVAPWFKDRVWQRSMCNNGVYHDLTHSLCYDDYACQKGKGTDLAIRRTIHFLQRFYRTTKSNKGYVVHADVRKYFPSTPHKLLHDIDERIITEPMFAPYLAEIIESVKDIRSSDEIQADLFGERGTGLGSQINQLHQVLLLDPIDHELKKFCKYYQRYMDDFLVIAGDRETCARAVYAISRMLAERGLEVKVPAGVEKLEKGFYFLRHRFILTDTGKVIVKLHPDSMRNERAALMALKGKLQRGEVDMAYIRQHYQCWIAQAEYCTGDGAIRNMDKYYTKLFRKKPEYKRKRRYLYGRQQNKLG